MSYPVVTLTFKEEIWVESFEGAHNEVDVFDYKDAIDPDDPEKNTRTWYTKGDEITGYLLGSSEGHYVIEDFHSTPVAYVPKRVCTKKILTKKAIDLIP